MPVGSYVHVYVRWWRSAKATASKIVRAIGIEVMHKQAYMMATMIQELRNEKQFTADFANGVRTRVPREHEGRRVWMAHNGFL